MYSYRVKKAGRFFYTLILVVAGVVLVGLGVKYGTEWLLAADTGIEEEINIVSLQQDAEMPAAGNDDPEDSPATQDITVEMLPIDPPTSFVQTGSTAQVLIYQTHTEEAYTMVAGAEYVEAAKWRTADNFNNIVRVGNALATQLSGVYGLSVLHDTTNYEQPKLGTAYNRSLVGIQENQKENPNLNVFIDVHRDAWNKNNTPNSVTIDGKQVARVMLVVGKGVDFKNPPDWEANLAFAQLICDKLAAINPDLSRGVSVKNGRYNQHVSNHSILIEVGHNQNTLEEAMNATPYIARAIYEALQEMPAANIN